MAKTNFKTVDEYHDTFAPEIKKRLQQMRKAIREVAPEAEELISYQVPAYKYHGFVVYYAGYAAHVSLSYPFSKELLEKFKKDMSKYKMSKSVIQFQNDEKLPIGLIKKIVKFRVKENLGK